MPENDWWLSPHRGDNPFSEVELVRRLHAFRNAFVGIQPGFSESCVTQSWRTILMNFWDAREARFRAHHATRPWSKAALQLWPRTMGSEPRGLKLCREHAVPIGIVARSLMAAESEHIDIFSKVLARSVMVIVTTHEDLGITRSKFRDTLPPDLMERPLWKLSPEEIDIRYTLAEGLGRPIDFEDGNRPSDVVRLVEARLASLLSYKLA